MIRLDLINFLSDTGTPAFLYEIYIVKKPRGSVLQLLWLDFKSAAVMPTEQACVKFPTALLIFAADFCGKLKNSYHWAFKGDEKGNFCREVWKPSCG